jgi:hypothetical protein
MSLASSSALHVDMDFEDAGKTDYTSHAPLPRAAAVVRFQKSRELQPGIIAVKIIAVKE